MDVCRIRFGVFIQRPIEVCTTFIVPHKDQKHKDLIIKGDLALSFKCFKHLLNHFSSAPPGLATFDEIQKEFSQILEQHGQILLFPDPIVIKNNRIKFDVFLCSKPLKTMDSTMKFVFQLQMTNPNSKNTEDQKIIEKIHKEMKFNPFSLRQINPTGFRWNCGNFDVFVVTKAENS